MPVDTGINNRYLTLITCAGAIVNGRFDHHVVVYTTRSEQHRDLPQMAEANTPQLQDATGEYSMYDEIITLPALPSNPVINQTGCGWFLLESISAKGTCMKPERQFSKMVGALSVLVLAVLTIAACSSPRVAAQLNDGTLTICHATGDATIPYEEITLTFVEFDHARRSRG